MQEAFVQATVVRVAAEEGIHERSVRITTRNGSGGIPAARAALRRYLDNLDSGAEERPDILVVCMDGDCEGPEARHREIRQLLGERAVPPCIAIATPDPYVERWYVLEPQAIKRALGRGPAAVQIPPRCSHDVFKELLSDTIESTGAVATLGGYEYADLIVPEVDLYAAGQADPAFDRFVSALRACFRRLLA